MTALCVSLGFHPCRLFVVKNVFINKNQKAVYDIKLAIFNLRRKGKKLKGIYTNIGHSWCTEQHAQNGSATKVLWTGDSSLC